MIATTFTCKLDYSYISLNITRLFCLSVDSLLQTVYQTQAY